MTKRLTITALLIACGFVAGVACEPSQSCTWAVPIYVDRCNNGDSAACEQMHACAPGSCGTPGAPPCD